MIAKVLGQRDELGGKSDISLQEYVSYLTHESSKTCWVVPSPSVWYTLEDQSLISLLWTTKENISPPLLSLCVPVMLQRANSLCRQCSVFIGTPWKQATLYSSSSGKKKRLGTTSHSLASAVASKELAKLWDLHEDIVKLSFLFNNVAATSSISITSIWKAAAISSRTSFRNELSLTREQSPPEIRACAKEMEVRLLEKL